MSKNAQIHIVEASAGSGKTFSLAKRYVQLLLQTAANDRAVNQSHLRSILAITFTNKAAFEMKQRILLFLKKMAFQQLASFEVEVILHPIGMNAQQAQPLAQRLMDDIIRSYHYFQVQTIDSFINTILTGCSYQLHMAARFKIERNARHYLEQALDRLIDQAPQDQHVERVMNAYLNQYLFIENRSSWFPKKELLALVTRLFQESNTYGLPFFCPMIEGKDIAMLKKNVLSLTHELKQSLPEGVHAGFAKALDQFIDHHPDSFDVDDLSNYFAREELPITKSAQVDSTTAALWSQLRDEVRRLCESEAFGSFNAYIEVYQALFDEFRRLVNKDDLIFLEELNHRAKTLFDEDRITVEELYYRLATRFKHYLIDEFQDTNRLQWFNLKPLIEEGLSTGGSLFYVGDKKQAIYGFRGGDSALFDTITQTFSHYTINVERLEQNYRSCPEIVRFNNAFFSLPHLTDFLYAVQDKNKDIAFSPDDLNTVMDLFAGAQQQARPDLIGGYVHAERIHGNNKEERYQKTANALLLRIEELGARYAWGDIAVLTRNNNEVEQVTSWLMEAGYTVDSERTSDIRLNRTIQELLSLLRFLNDPSNNVFFVEWITSTLFASLTDHEAADRHQFIFSLRTRLHAEKGLVLYHEFQEAYPETWEQWVQPFLRDVGLYPLYELLSSIVNRFEVCARFPDDQAFVMYFCELIKSKEDEYNDLSSFLEYFDELDREDVYLTLNETNAIHVLTVHKAKGLEFPVVIVPFLGINVQVGSGRGDGHASYTLLPQQDDMRLIRLKNKYTIFSSTLKNCYDQEYKKSLLSELNNLYVALTRPTQELYLIVPNKVGSRFNLAQLLIDDDFVDQGAPFDLTPAEAHHEFALTIPSGKSHHWIDFLHDEFQDDSYVSSYEGAYHGEILHDVLASLTDNNDDDPYQRAQEAVALVEQRRSDYVDWHQYHDLVVRVIQHPDWKRFFVTPQADVYCEYDLVDRRGHTHRVDRLVVLPQQIWLLDYKTGTRRDEHQQQINRYVKVLQDIFPRHQIKAFLGYVDCLELVGVS